MTYTKSKMGITSEGFNRIAKGLGLDKPKKRAQEENENYDASELVLYIDNTGSLYPKRQAIYSNLIKKIKQGVYDSQLAVQGFMHLVEEGAKMYAKEFGMGQWSKAWPKEVRQAAAEEMVNNFEVSDEVAELEDPEFYDLGAQEKRLQQSAEHDKAMDAEQFATGIEARIIKALNKSKRAYPIKTWDKVEKFLEEEDDENVSDSLVKYIEPENHEKSRAARRSAATEPRIYVGTYAKYNSGSIKGKWLDLDDYSDYEEFMDAAKELHKDEADPELMFQDWEGIPDWAISESYLDPKYFDVKDRMADLNEEAFNIFVNYYYGTRMTDDIDEAIDNFEEAYQGEFGSMTDFVYQLVDDIGLDGIGNIEMWFDYKKFARDLQYEGYEDISQLDAEENPDEYPDGEGVYFNGEFMGSYDSIEDMVSEWLDEGIIGEDNIKNYFNYERYGRDLEMGGDFWEDGGYVFRSI